MSLAGFKHYKEVAKRVPTVVVVAVEGNVSLPEPSLETKHFSPHCKTIETRFVIKKIPTPINQYSTLSRVL